MLKKKLSSKKSTLTSREKEIVLLCAQGKRAVEIADCLDISMRTVEAHKTNIFKKIHVHNMAEMLRYAYKNRLISFNDD